MHHTYRRLMQAARELKGWTTASEISDGVTALGYEVSAQMLTNWKNRGVSRDALLALPRLIGCSAEWLAHGHGDMHDGIPAQNAASQLQEPSGVYRAMSPEERELIHEYERLTPTQRREYLERMREQAEANSEVLRYLGRGGDQ